MTYYLYQEHGSATFVVLRIPLHCNTHPFLRTRFRRYVSGSKLGIHREGVLEGHRSYKPLEPRQEGPKQPNKLQ